MGNKILILWHNHPYLFIIGIVTIIIIPRIIISMINITCSARLQSWEGRKEKASSSILSPDSSRLNENCEKINWKIFTRKNMFSSLLGGPMIIDHLHLDQLNLQLYSRLLVKPSFLFLYLYIQLYLYHYLYLYSRLSLIPARLYKASPELRPWLRIMDLKRTHPPHSSNNHHIVHSIWKGIILISKIIIVFYIAGPEMAEIERCQPLLCHHQPHHHVHHHYDHDNCGEDHYHDQHNDNLGEGCRRLLWGMGSVHSGPQPLLPAMMMLLVIMMGMVIMIVILFMMMIVVMMIMPLIITFSKLPGLEPWRRRDQPGYRGLA